MADDEALPPPLEIPWQLASTTQPLAAGDPDETTISLFSFEPDDEELTNLFPDERLIFLKLTTTISPAAFPGGIPPVPGAALGEGVPCFHALLDLRVRRSGGDPGTIRPYFHAAAPLYRRTIQSGAVGLEVVEGESDEQFVGRSGSQLHESSSTRAATTSIGVNASLGIGSFSIGGSVRSTDTAVRGERAVSQVVDTTSRDASQERRELTSHHTKVENVLTLLNAKYVGTPTSGSRFRRDPCSSSPSIRQTRTCGSASSCSAARPGSRACRSTRPSCWSHATRISVSTPGCGGSVSWTTLRGR